MRRVVTALGRVCFGVLLGLVIAELVFWVRDDGAFPHVNLYEADLELGTRLQPNSSQRLAFTGNPATKVRVNSRGHRGPEWPAPSPDELVMVGDSQVFGLGVEETDTIGAELAGVTGRQVINAGVPTYGPSEYLAVAKRVVEERHSAEVVLVFNAANDFFELERPNTSRHVVWDGWAVRAEHGPSDVTDFPGRRWFMSQSHLVFALRKLWFSRQHVRSDSELLDAFSARAPLAFGVPSEGSWTELLSASEQHHTLRTEFETKAKAEARELSNRVKPAVAEVSAAQRQLSQALEAPTTPAPWGPLGIRSESQADALLAKNVGDIVLDTGSELARPIPVTAELLARAAEAKRAFAQHRRTAARERLEFAKKLAPLEASLRDAALRLDVARWDLPEERQADELGAAWLDLLAAFQRDVCPVTLVMLPLDVQVSPVEWAKYGEPPVDMRQSLELNRAFEVAARARGVRTVNLIEPLDAAEPNAFLLGDLHLTPKGTAAAATAIAKALQTPRPEVLLPGLPEGHSLLPSPAEWRAASEFDLKGLTEASCEAKQVREWVKVACSSAGLQLRAGQPADSQLMVSSGGASAIFPVRPGVTVQLEILPGLSGAWLLEVTWAPGAQAPLRAMSPLEQQLYRETPKHPSAVTARCFEALSPKNEIPWGRPDADDECGDANDCLFRLACLQGHPNAKPRCKHDEVNAGPDFRCLRRCRDDGECLRSQRCELWRGVHACRERPLEAPDRGGAPP